MFYSPIHFDPTTQNWPQPAPHSHAAGSVTHSDNELYGWNTNAAVNGSPPREPTPPTDAVAYEYPSQPNPPAAMQGSVHARYIQMSGYAEDSSNPQSGGAGIQLKQQKAEILRDMGIVPMQPDWCGRPAAAVGFAGSSMNTLSTVDSSATASAGVKSFSVSSEGAGTGASRRIANHTDNQALSSGSNVFFVHCRLSAWVFMPTVNCCMRAISTAMLDMATQVLTQQACTHNLLLAKTT